MCQALNNQGVVIGVHKTRTLMKKAGIFAKMPKIRHQYEPDLEKPDIPNKLNREYNPLRLNKVLWSDITYIRSATGWSYLATVFDLGTKEVVDHAMSQTADTDLVIKALDHAIGKHRPKTKQLMFHSDQGGQYTSKKTA